MPPDQAPNHIEQEIVSTTRAFGLNTVEERTQGRNMKKALILQNTHSPALQPPSPSSSLQWPSQTTTGSRLFPKQERAKGGEAGTYSGQASPSSTHHEVRYCNRSYGA